MSRRPSPRTWKTLNREVILCKECPRLIEYCQEVARTKRKAFAHESYWGKPCPNFGDAKAQLLVHGLAPAAHGANRTGRMFTGDRSGLWLYRALYRAGFSNKEQSQSADDGLELINAAITSVIHCAPPDNKPLPDEIEACRHWLNLTLDLVPWKVVVALGGISWRSFLREAKQRGWIAGRMPSFGHGVEVQLIDGRWLIGSYHPSQQNTFTKRLTEEMLDAVFSRARELIQTY